MWYEILPTYITITTVLAIPNLFVYFSNKLLLSQPFRRKIVHGEETFKYLRDSELSPRLWAYDFFGLENIPDDISGTADTPQSPEKETTSNC